MRGCWGVQCLSCRRPILLPLLDFEGYAPLHPGFDPSPSAAPCVARNAYTTTRIWFPSQGPSTCRIARKADPGLLVAVNSKGGALQ